VGYKAGNAPFNHTDWPVYIEAVVRTVDGWNEVDNSADLPPSSPACTSSNSCG